MLLVTTLSGSFPAYRRAAGGGRRSEAEPEPERRHQEVSRLIGARQAGSLLRRCAETRAARLAHVLIPFCCLRCVGAENRGDLCCRDRVEGGAAAAPRRADGRRAARVSPLPGGRRLCGRSQGCLFPAAPASPSSVVDGRAPQGCPFPPMNFNQNVKYPAKTLDIPVKRHYDIGS